MGQFKYLSRWLDSASADSAVAAPLSCTLSVTVLQHHLGATAVNIAAAPRYYLLVIKDDDLHDIDLLFDSICNCDVPPRLPHPLQ